MKEKITFIIFFVFIFQFTVLCQSKFVVNEGVISACYSFPSIEKFLLQLESRNNAYYNLNGFGPLQSKVEYIYKGKIGVVTSLFYNQLSFKFNNQLKDTFMYKVNDFSVIGRLNYYFINNNKRQFYIGAGLGKVFFNNRIIRITNPLDTFLKVTPVLTNFNKLASESTIGYRQLIYKNFAYFAELGIGRTINQFLKKGDIESIIQIGIAFRIRRKE